MLLAGQGEGHLRLALERLKRRFGVEVATARPQDALPRDHPQERRPSAARHKKQTGGHGQFGDVIDRVKPLPRGQGFEFVDKITGGAVPRQWIPAVEAGRPRRADQGTAGLPGDRPGGDADRRLIPRGRLHPKWPSARPGRIGMNEGAGRLRARSCWSRSRSCRSTRPPARRTSPRRCPAARPDPGLRAARGLAGLGSYRRLPAASERQT